MPVINPADYQLTPDFSPVGQAIGSLVSRRIAERLGQKALQGDEAAYAKLAARDPKVANAIGSIMQTRQERAAAQRVEAEKEAEKQRAEAEKQRQQKLDLTLKAAQGYLRANDKAAYLQYAGEQMAQAGHADVATDIARLSELYAQNPGAVDQEVGNAIALLAPQPKAESLSPVGDLMRERDALPAGDPRRATYDAAIKKATTISEGQNVNVSINDGKQDLTKTTASDVQGKILDAEQELSSLDAIANKYSGDFLTFKGRAKAYAGKQLDRAGIESELTGFNAKRTAFKNEVNQFFNKYKKEITGAAAGEQEMIDLRNSIFNEDLGPEEFMSAYNQFKVKARKNYELNKRTARTGVDVAVDPKYKDMSDADLKKALGL